MTVNGPREQLCQVLGYVFQDPRLLTEALTHRSAASVNNERLEFLGDSILSLVISEALLKQYPYANEGDLSRLRASLVKGVTLAKLARELALGNCLQLGPGELKSGGDRRDSILADTLEALLGALLIDAGFSRCREIILTLFHDRLAALPSADALKDPKTRLQEYLQAHRQALPAYNVLEISGADHARSFKIECVAAEQHAVAIGRSRRIAEQEAARKILAVLESAYERC